VVDEMSDKKSFIARLIGNQKNSKSSSSVSKSNGNSNTDLPQNLDENHALANYSVIDNKLAMSITLDCMTENNSEVQFTEPSSSNQFEITNKPNQQLLFGIDPTNASSSISKNQLNKREVDVKNAFEVRDFFVLIFFLLVKIGYCFGIETSFYY
jgi:hypothetical protein